MVVVTVMVAVVFTFMLCVVSPVLQTFPDTALEVSVTLSPLQKVVEPLAEMVGVAGIGLTVTLTVFELADLHSSSVVVTVKFPEEVTLIDWVTCPVLHSLPVASLEISITLSPWQKVVLPTTVIVGVAGIGFTVTTVGAEVAEQPVELILVTVKLPLFLTVMLLEVSPLLHTLPAAALEVSITLSPLQKVSGLLADIVGVGGNAFTVIVIGADGADEHPKRVTDTEKVPNAITLMLCVVSPLLHTFPDVAPEVKMTLSPWQKVVLPVMEILGVGGIEFATIVVGNEVALHPFASVAVTEKSPLPFTVIL